MQHGEATLPTATPSQTCPSCCTSLPTGSLPTGIPQQPQRSRWQRAVNLSLPFAEPRGCCLFPLAPSTFSCLGAQQSRICWVPTRWVPCNTAQAAGRNPQARQVFKTTSWVMVWGF